MNSQKDYWDKKISEWSTSSYGKTGKVSLTERIATYFRRVNLRKEAGLKLIGPKAKNKIILDLGCGLGEFALGILLRYQPKKVIASDISQVAINSLKKLATEAKLKSKMDFLIADISNLEKLPDFDIAVGLGFIDYLNRDQMKHLFKLLDKKPFLFSYFEKNLSLFNLFHKLYITIQGCPGAYKYTRREIRSFLPKKSKLYFIKKNGLMFITNSPNIK